MSRVQINMPSGHGDDLIFHFTPYQLIKFRSHILNSRHKSINSRIDGKYFNFSNSGIIFYKGKTFKGPGYGIYIDGLIGIIDNAFNEFSK